jgi:hypothetical protein
MGTGEKEREESTNGTRHNFHVETTRHKEGERKEKGG